MLVKGGDYVPGMTCKTATGARFSDNSELVKRQAMAKPGDRIFIEGIKGIGPDKKPRSLNSIILTLN
jgi:hypothetical protein